MAYGNEKVIMGVGCATHDSSASLIVGNKLVAAIEEERLTRKKHDNSFPYQSIKFCLERENVLNDQVDTVVIGWTPYGNFWKKFAFLFYKSLHPKIMYRKVNFLRALYFTVLDYRTIAQKLFPKAQVKFLEHHLAHAASSFFVSPFEKSSIMTLDGRGEWSTGLLGLGEGTKIKKIQESFWPQSLGIVYLAFTNYLGFGMHDEYKVMGLAAYGKPTYLDEMRKIFHVNPKKIFHVNLDYIKHPSYSNKCKSSADYWTPLIEKIFGPARKPDEKVTSFHMDIANSLQTRLNEVSIQIVDYLLKLTSSKNLCLSGGVCLNGVMNYHIYKELNLENIYIQPASSDGGVSLGAALYAHHCFFGCKQKIEFNNAYLGSDYSNEEIEKELKNYGISFYKLTNTSDTVAKLLYNGKIIAWFQGRSEFGPRALGSRSILADPRPAENKDIVNARIKFREEFRPFAPSVLEEYSNEWFELDTISPYMLMIPKVRDKKRGLIQAVTHVNGTARPQTVSKLTNPKYHSLIESFFKLTNCPVILNTSFNVKGEPIVNSPSDALRCFFSTGLDYLVIGDFIISKNMDYNEILAIDKDHFSEN